MASLPALRIWANPVHSPRLLGDSESLSPTRCIPLRSLPTHLYPFVSSLPLTWVSLPPLGHTHHLHAPLVCDGPLAVRPWHPNHGLQGRHVVVVDGRLNPHLGQRTQDRRALNASHPSNRPSRGSPPWLRSGQGQLVLEVPAWATCGSGPSPRGTPSHTQQGTAQAASLMARLTPQGEGGSPPCVPTALHVSSKTAKQLGLSVCGLRAP